MKRAVKAGELFATFIFDGKDCADMGVYNVTSGSTYTFNMEPNFSDNKKTVPAYDGQYYYGTQISGQQFKFKCFAHDLSSQEYDRLRAWLNPRKIGKLILSDQPYKYYLVKPVSISTLGEIPLTSIQTPSNSMLGDPLDGDVVYTGNFDVTFETTGSAYGYGMCYYRDDLIYDAKEKYGRDYYYNSGLLYKDMNPDTHWNVPANAKDVKIPMYNPGSAEGKPIYTIKHTGTFAKNSYIQITNNTLNTSTVIDIGGTTGDVRIDMTTQTIEDSAGNVFYGRFKGSAMTIQPYGALKELPETWVENIEDSNLTEYDSFYIKDNVVSINPKILLVTEDMVGQYFSANMNGGSQIQSVNITENTLTLDPEVYTADILPGEGANGIVIRPAGFAFNYIEVNNVMPAEGEEGYVCLVNGVMYLYRKNKDGKGEWLETNLFSSKEDFQNIYGDYITQYRVFGGTITELDDITITTGTNINYLDELKEVKPGTAVPEFTLWAELQPRYL